MVRTFFDFNVAEERKKKVDEYYNDLKTGGRDVYIFGVGEYAEMLKEFLKLKGIYVKDFVLSDHFAKRMPGVLSLSDVISRDDVRLIYGLQSGYSKHFYKMIEQVQAEVNRAKNTDLFIPSDYWLIEQGSQYFSHEYLNADYLKEHFAEFEQTYEMLADDLSRNVMTEYLYAPICHDASKLAELGSGWDYDYDMNLLFKTSKGDVVIECGAFDGKTIVEASKFTNNKYEMLALECDPENYRKCCEKVTGFSNIKVLKIGAWNKKTKLSVVQLDSASFLKETDACTETTNVVEVVDIDSLVSSKSVAAVIMDIEGSEMKALEGAQNAIKNGANLAIRVYHRKDDLITIPQFIKKINGSYRFYLRFERGASLCRAGDETTLYAVCE